MLLFELIKKRSFYHSLCPDTSCARLGCQAGREVKAGSPLRKPTQKKWEFVFSACCFYLLLGGRCRTEPGGEGRDQIEWKIYI